MALVHVEIEDHLDEVSTRYLVKELERRRERGDKDIPDEPFALKDALFALKRQRCPEELYRLLEEWATGHLSIVDCMALKTK